MAKDPKLKNSVVIAKVVDNLFISPSKPSQRAVVLPHDSVFGGNQLAYFLCNSRCSNGLEALHLFFVR